MSHQVLARKWRPGRFEDLVGQEHVLRALVNALDNDRLHHAYLFSGTRGVGKTTLARILARSLNCEQGVSSTPCGTCAACQEITEGRFVDLIEVDAASRTKVDDTRELLDNVQYAPTRGRFKVYLIDEVHMLSTHSFNALLKTLEEPPPHVKFLLATTDPQKLPITVLSRCLQLNLKRLPEDLIIPHLEKVLGGENIQFERPALRAIAHAAEGSMRDALSLLDQGIAFGNGAVGEHEINEMLGSISRTHLTGLLAAIADGDGSAALAQVAEMATMAPDYEQVIGALITMLHDLALAQHVPESLELQGLDVHELSAIASNMHAEDIQLFYEIAVHSRRDLPMVPDPRHGLEMAVLRMLAFRPARPAPAAQGEGGAPDPLGKELASPSSATNRAGGAAAALATARQTSAADPSLNRATDVLKAEAPKAEAPKAEAPKAEAPKAEVPKAEVPKAEVPKAEVPKAEVPKAEVPKAEVPKAEVPKAEVPKAEVPKAEVPKAEVPKAEVPKAEVPRGQAISPAGSGASSASAASQDGPPDYFNDVPLAQDYGFDSGSAAGHLSQEAPNVPSAGLPPHAESSPAAQRVEQTQAAPAVVSDTPVEEALDAPGDRVELNASNWEHVLSQVPMSGMTRAFASHCALVMVDSGGTVVLQLSERHESFRNESLIEKLAKGLTDYFGRPYKVRVDLSEEKPDSPAEKKRLDSERRQVEAEASIESDPVVAEFKQQFGAAIIKGSVKPNHDNKEV